MSREILNDFLTLRAFLNGYNLSHLLTDESFKAFVSQQHKKYFSYLTFIAEIQNYVDDVNYVNTISSIQFPFLKESCSDSGISFFSTFHGSYKSSKLLLRSSIETFLKGYFLDLIPDLDKESSMYELFRKIKALPFCSVEPIKSIIDLIHGKYKLLCQDVHTATNLNMVNLSALNYFPSFDKVEATKVSDSSLLLISNYLTLLCLKYNEQFHAFHYKNKKIIINSIPKEYRQIVNNIAE